MPDRVQNEKARQAGTAATICLFFATLMAAANAQRGDELRVDIAPCIDVESALERLDCYDALARDALGGSESAEAEPDGSARPDAAAAPDVTNASDAAGAEDSFGFAAERERRSERNGEELDELTSEVAALREIVPGQLEITLTNGQVWRQTNSDRYNLQIGHPVRIYPTRFGQYYRLTSEILRGFVQVERIR